MNLIEILSIAIGLSMDAFAVSLSEGMNLAKIKLSNMLKIGFVFGFFQAIMPLIGWFAAGSLFRNFIEKYDNPIAFSLLCYIGCKMLYDSFQSNDDKSYTALDSRLKILVLGIATSIDALMLGITFVSYFNDTEIITPVLIIGLTTFLISSSGVFLGRKFGDILGKKSTVAGGIILIFIALKMFFT